MVRAACSDAGSGVAGDEREPLVTELMFPLSSLEQPRVPRPHYRDRFEPGPYQASEGVPSSSPEGQMALFDRDEVD